MVQSENALLRAEDVPDLYRVVVGSGCQQNSWNIHHIVLACGKKPAHRHRSTSFYMCIPRVHDSPTTHSPFGFDHRTQFTPCVWPRSFMATPRGTFREKSSALSSDLRARRRAGSQRCVCEAGSAAFIFASAGMGMRRCNRKEENIHTHTHTEKERERQVEAKNRYRPRERQ